MKRTTGGPPRLVALESTPLKKPAIPHANFSRVKALLKPRAKRTAKETVTPPINIFRVEGAIRMIIQTPRGIPNELPMTMGRIFFRFTFLKEWDNTKILPSSPKSRFKTTTLVGVKIKSRIGARMSANPNPETPLIRPAKKTAHRARIQEVLKISRLCKRFPYLAEVNQGTAAPNHIDYITTRPRFVQPQPKSDQRSAFSPDTDQWIEQHYAAHSANAGE